MPKNKEEEGDTPAERTEDLSVMFSCAVCGTIFFRQTDLWMPGVTDRHADSVRRLMIEIEVAD